MFMLNDTTTKVKVTDVSVIPGLKELWAETIGDPRICIAVLDGPVERSHPSLAAANLTQLDTLVSGIADRGSALQHGTHVASVIFGQHDGLIKGIAPHCRGLVVPVFTDGVAGSLAPCSQIDLARAILQAAQQDAHIINISGGQLVPSGTAHPLLADAVRYCANNGILIVAAAGNEGCDCLHIPGALPSVLAVGAMNWQGMPLDFSNWGERYQTQGILAPGENILGASPGGGTIPNSGTSYATPIVSGIAALLLSLQLKRGHEPNPHAVRAAILESAIACDDQPVPDCRRLLAGRLNVKGAMSLVLQGEDTMTDSSPTPEAADFQLPMAQMPAPEVQAATYSSNSSAATVALLPETGASSTTSKRSEDTVNYSSVAPSGVTPSACSCQGGGSPTVQLVYPLGQLGYDFGTEARRDSIMQHMSESANPQDPNQLLAYLENNPWDAAAILWTLSLDATPIYAIQPQGPFASDVYQRLRQFLREQLSEGVERVSIPGIIVGSVRLMSGQAVPVVQPAIRGMYSWTTTALIEAILGSTPPESAEEREREAYFQRAQAVTNFLERVYYELRNLGMTPQERAINFAATNAFNVEKVFEAAIREEMDLDIIEVERSPLCRPDSDCWDVKLTFFNPGKVFEQARKVYRFTVDVSDVVPVTVGRVRSWFVR